MTPRQTDFVGKIFHRRSALGGRHAGVEIVVEQHLEFAQRAVVQLLAGYKLPLVEAHAIVEHHLDVGDDKRLRELVDRMLQLPLYLAHIVLQDYPLLRREVKRLVGGVGEEGILLNLLSQRGAEQKIGMEQQPYRLRQRTLLHPVHSHRLPRRETHHGVVVEVVSGFTIIDYTPRGLLDEEGVESEMDAMVRLVHSLVEMHDAHQGMARLKSEISVVFLNAVGFVDFHIQVFCREISHYYLNFKTPDAVSRNQGLLFGKEGSLINGF